MHRKDGTAGIVEITEGSTRLLVPSESISGGEPPVRPAFFNPRARMNRDVSVLATSAFCREFSGPKIFLDCLASLGPRGIRIANETEAEEVIINDLNPSALKLAEESVRLNGLDNVRISEKEACGLCGDFSKKGSRASMVDIDPFGSPARFVDCAMRATMHGGIMSATATDLQVLGGIYPDACTRRYGGAPARTKYGNETAIRLVLGCTRHIAARMDIKIVPLYAECDMHYYRTYVRILNRPDQSKNLGYITHCDSCGARETSAEYQASCSQCGSHVRQSGPLWTGEIFDAAFVRMMSDAVQEHKVDGNCKKNLDMAAAEAGMPAAYYTSDEIASRTKQSAMPMNDILEALESVGYRASRTSFSQTGFKTDAPVAEIKRIFCNSAIP